MIKCELLKMREDVRALEFKKMWGENWREDSGHKNASFVHNQLYLSKKHTSITNILVYDKSGKEIVLNDGMRHSCMCRSSKLKYDYVFDTVCTIYVKNKKEFNKLLEKVNSPEFELDFIIEKYSKIILNRKISEFDKIDIDLKNIFSEVLGYNTDELPVNKDYISFIKKNILNQCISKKNITDKDIFVYLKTIVMEDFINI